jgi:hypothetical protein
MNLGQQLFVPQGFRSLKTGQRYYFLKSNGDSGLTALATFPTQEKGRRIHIHHLPTRDFQKGVADGDIIFATELLTLPPWLGRVEGMDLFAVDVVRGTNVRPNKSLAEQRFGYIEGLLPHLSEILLAQNPFLIINEHARELSPKQNRTRLAEWFFSYICHSFQIEALWPEYSSTGTYDKSAEKYNDTHFGRHSEDKGKHYGWPSSMFTDEIIKVVDSMLGKKWTKHKIYLESLKQVWGCRARKSERGDWEMYQPEGKPFPDTEGKFWYRWYQHLDLASTNLSLYGEHHVRSKAGTKGPYSQNVSSLLSKVEVDAYYLDERPRLTHGDENSSRLCVARGVCVGTKYVVGVGFSLEGESAYAYRMMLFCAAIGLDAFALLWGLEKEALLDVLVKGLPPHLISDRGKAPTSAIINSLQSQFPVRELTETYSGQSKPSVESGHPRQQNIEGPPAYLISDKDIVQLIQREICRAAKDNHVRNIKPLIVGSRAFSETVCSPYALAQQLDADGLNDAIQIHFDTAVRSYLIETTFVLRDGGFWLGNRCFSNAELDSSNVYPSLSPGQDIKISGYHMPLNLMHVWLEFNGRLHQLRQKLPVRLGEREQMLSMEELEKEAEIRRALESEQRRSAGAADLEAQKRYEDYVGASWGNTKRKSGRPRKTPDTAIEKKILSPKPSRKKAA